MTTTALRGRPLALTVAATLTVLLVAVVTGSSLAAWRTSDSVELSFATARTVFAAGPARGPLVRADAQQQTVAHRFGPQEAARLVEEQSLTIPLRVDALSQGHNGLRYEIGVPTFPAGSVFAHAQVSVVRASGPDGCPDGATPPGSTPLVSTPVPASYSDDTTPTTEYWCLRATLGELPDEGLHTSTATASGQAATGPVQGSMRWHARVTTALDPAAEPVHELTFTYTVLRPGT